MTLPSSGQLSLSDIQTEFGGSNPIGLNEYYAGGTYVPSGTSGTNGAVPSSGQISLWNFYGTSNIDPNIGITWSANITSAPYNLQSKKMYFNSPYIFVKDTSTANTTWAVSTDSGSTFNNRTLAYDIAPMNSLIASQSSTLVFGSTYVTFGTNGQYVKTSDGITFTASTLTLSGSMSTFASAKSTTNSNIGRWIGSTSGRGVVTSDGGSTFSESSIGAGGTVSGLANKNGRFMAVSTSTSGLTYYADGSGSWTANTAISGNVFYGMCANSSNFYATGRTAASPQPILLTSSDGITSTITQPFTFWTSGAGGKQGEQIYWDGAKLICFGEPLSTGVTQVATSPDGITWTNRTSTAPALTGTLTAWDAVSKKLWLWLTNGTSGTYRSSS